MCNVTVVGENKNQVEDYRLGIIRALADSIGEPVRHGGVEVKIVKLSRFGFAKAFCLSYGVR